MIALNETLIEGGCYITSSLFPAKDFMEQPNWDASNSVVVYQCWFPLTTKAKKHIAKLESFQELKKGLGQLRGKYSLFQLHC